MGIYAVPKGRDKERWLEEVGVELKEAPGWPPPDGTLPVVLVTNRQGDVAFRITRPLDQSHPTDDRARRYFLVPVARLREATDERDWSDRRLVPPWLVPPWQQAAPT